MPREKIYLQFNKPVYLSGDTMWFKAYVFDAAYLSPSKQSGILYIDIADENNNIVKQYMLPVAGGVSWGNLPLNPQDFSEGSYTLRAYTNLLKNFGSNNFFYHHFYVAGNTGNAVLVKTQTQVFGNDANDSVVAALKFTGPNMLALANEPLELAVKAGKKRLLRGNVTTGSNGVAKLQFVLPAGNTTLTVTAKEKNNNRETTIPLTLNRSQNIDLQFMPEGGYLVAGITSLVGFKAVGEDGHGTNITGIIVNSSNTCVAAFKSLHNGMGSFYITPALNENYTAIITLTGGRQLKFSLPQAKPNGLVIHVGNSPAQDSLDISAAITNGFIQSAGNMFLVAMSRDVFCFGMSLNFGAKAGTIHKKIAKKLFPRGIVQFTVLQGLTPVCQRLIFINLQDSVQLAISTADTVHAPRDSIALKLSFGGAGKKGLAGNFSLAVTDDEVVKHDSANANIASYILLSSDVKGYVEDPGFYFRNGDSTALNALDNLLLTQGWAGYDWEQIFKPAPPLFGAEEEFTVRGTLLNVLNKKVSHAKIGLLSSNPAIVMDTATDDNGRFIFHNFPVIDTPVFFIQAKNKKGKNIAAGIEIDTSQVPPFIAPATPAVLPWYINPDTTLIKQVQVKQEMDKKLFEGLTLAPVTVSAKKRVDGSANLNGPGNADITLDKNDMAKLGRKTLLDLLKEKISNFHEGLFPPLGVTHDLKQSKPNWLISDKAVALVIDGINVDANFVPFEGGPDIEPRNWYEKFLESYLTYITAEDIKGIEVCSSAKYNFTYNIRYHREADAAKGIDWVYVEVTTWSGRGPFLRIPPGTIIYKPLPFSMPVKFYSPRYTIKDTGDKAVDLRTTIFWQPNIITDSTGSATVWFYAADKPATYTIIAEGTDFNGNVAVATKKIVIKRQ